MMVITAGYFFQRIGEDDERARDREFWSALAMWKWRADWRAAEEAKDWGRLDALDRDYEMIQSL